MNAPCAKCGAEPTCHLDADDIAAWYVVACPNHCAGMITTAHLHMEEACQAWSTLVACNNAPFTDADARLALGNLLAVIHRDGGHTIDRLGWRQACTIAESIVVQLRTPPGYPH